MCVYHEDKVHSSWICDTFGTTRLLWIVGHTYHGLIRSLSLSLVENLLPLCVTARESPELPETCMKELYGIFLERVLWKTLYKYSLKFLKHSYELTRQAWEISMNLTLDEESIKHKPRFSEPYDKYQLNHKIILQIN